MGKNRKLYVLVLLLLVSGMQVRPGLAQSSVLVERDEITLNFPTAINFHLDATAPSPVTRLYLLYGTNGRSCFSGGGRQEVDVTPGSHVSVNWEWDLNRAGSLPSGARLWWQWELVTDSGAKLLTDRQEFDYQDPNYDWLRLESGDVTVQWAAGDQDFGRDMLELGLESLERLEMNTGARPPSGVRLVLYPDSEALQAVALHAPEWTGGIAYPEYGVTMIGLGPGLRSWAEEVVPHELAHLVVDEITFNCFGTSLPTWLNEGLAVMNEGEVSSNEMDGVLEALAQDNLPTLRLLAAGFPAGPVEAGLAYDQSGAVVRFMSETYGPEEIADLLEEVSAGKLIDPALVAVYGFDTDGLEQAWRASLGYDFELPPTATPGTGERTAVPTLALPTLGFGSPATPTPTPSMTPLVPNPTPIPATAAAQGLPTCDPNAADAACAPSPVSEGPGDSKSATESEKASSSKVAGVPITVLVLVAFAALALIGFGVYFFRKH